MIVFDKMPYIYKYLMVKKLQKNTDVKSLNYRTIIRVEIAPDIISDKKKHICNKN